MKQKIKKQYLNKGESALWGAKIVVILYYFSKVPCLNFNYVIIVKYFHNVFSYYGRPKLKNIKCQRIFGICHESTQVGPPLSVLSPIIYKGIKIAMKLTIFSNNTLWMEFFCLIIPLQGLGNIYQHWVNTPFFYSCVVTQHGS